MNKLISSRYIFYISILIVLLQIIDIYCVYEINHYKSLINSDTLYLPSIYKDLFQDGGNFFNWNFNPAPNFFPDMPIFFLVSLFSSNFLIAAIAYAMVQYTVIIVLYKGILSHFLDNNSAFTIATVSNLLLGLFLINTVPNNSLSLSFFLIINSYHTSSFVLTLLMIYLSLKYYTIQKPIYLTIACIVTFLGVFSDRLTFVSIAAPFLIVLIFIKKSPFNKETILKFNGYVVFFSCFSLVFFSIIQSLRILKIDQPHKILAFQDIVDSLTLFMNHFVNSESLIYKFSAFVLSIGIIYSIYSLFKKEKLTIGKYLVLFSSLYSLIIISATIINGNFTGIDCLRYNIYPFHLALLNIPLIFFLIKPKWFKEVNTLFTPSLLGLYLFFGIYNFSYDGLKFYCNYYPENVKSIDEIAKKENLKNGIGNYWESKYITLFSKENLKVCTVFPECTKYYHGSNEDWYHNRTFNFIVDRDINHDFVKEFIKIDSITHVLNNPPIIKTPNFRFKTDTWSPEPTN